MNKKTSKKHQLTYLGLCVLSALSTSVVAQQAQDDDSDQDKKPERISVLGSHIKGNHDNGALPITAMSDEDITNTGALTGAELLAEIPQVGEVNFTSERVSGGVNGARGDVSSINLRGIGTGYTLTMLNGRRLVLHPGTQAENLVPVTTVNANTLPVRGLNRIEVLRDGAAAIYGSDAIAGVINYALKDDYEGSELNWSVGGSEGTSLEQMNLSGATGLFFNDNRSHLTLSGGYFKRSGIMANERAYSANEDLRQYPGIPEEFVDDTQLDNRSTGTPWGEFSSDTLGTFHIQPDTESGCENGDDYGNPSSALGVDGVCVDRGSITGSGSRAQRYNRNSARSLSSDVSRTNVYALLNHELSDDIELFAEALYYNATANRLRERRDNLSTQRFTVAADAYYNPFDEEVTVRRYRPVDAGFRRVNVKDYSYRLLTGLKGYYEDWDWESAVLYSKANTLDSTNRINTTLFQNAVNSTDAQSAYNIFNGGDVNNITAGDATPNSQEVIDSFQIQIDRESETELALWDFKVSKSDLFSLPAGDVGFATGVEYRYESFFDVRSDHLNGGSPFVDVVGDKTNSGASVVLGSSPTPNASGNRNVLSVYAEFAVPILEGLPLMERLDMQLAARYERFSDVGSVLKPKVAFAWKVNDQVKIRSSYAEGFRAPGLPQVVAENISRVNTRSDPVFGVRQGVLELRNGSDQLKPEESENISYGVVFEPTRDITVSVDWWNIKQFGVVGLLNSQTQILYDALLRGEGSSNPLVVRDDNNEIVQVRNDYTNLLPREIQGIDFSIRYDLDTQYGDYTFKLNGAKLQKFEQGVDDVTAKVLAAQAAGNEAVLYNGEQVTLSGTGDLIRKNGRPNWRANASIGWRYEQFGAGIKYKYISSFEDTSLDYTDEAGEKVTYKVASLSTIDVYLKYRLDTQGWFDKTTMMLGVRNLQDKEPPFSDNTFGYNSSTHSSKGRYFYLNMNVKF
ncbi:MAG: TonB-dependent receptor [Psychrosphaera sp.]|nr:TonB-dependent receptor [Psychrosphaera sp.]